MSYIFFLLGTFVKLKHGREFYDNDMGSRVIDYYVVDYMSFNVILPTVQNLLRTYIVSQESRVWFYFEIFITHYMFEELFRNLRPFMIHSHRSRK